MDNHDILFKAESLLEKSILYSRIVQICGQIFSDRIFDLLHVPDIKDFANLSEVDIDEIIEDTLPKLDKMIPELIGFVDKIAGDKTKADVLSHIEIAKEAAKRIYPNMVVKNNDPILGGLLDLVDEIDRSFKNEI